jgi:hypothetical protein
VCIERLLNVLRKTVYKTNVGLYFSPIFSSELAAVTTVKEFKKSKHSIFPQSHSIILPTELYKPLNDVRIFVTFQIIENV